MIIRSYGDLVRWLNDACARPIPPIVTGGEEFTILLPMTTSADGAVISERIRRGFKKETFSPTPGQDVHVTVSIGNAQYKPQEDMKASAGLTSHVPGKREREGHHLFRVITSKTHGGNSDSGG